MPGLIGCGKMRPDAHHLEGSSVFGFGRCGAHVRPVIAGSAVPRESGIDLEVHSGAALGGGSRSRQTADLLN